MLATKFGSNEEWKQPSTAATKHDSNKAWKQQSMKATEHHSRNAWKPEMQLWSSQRMAHIEGLILTQTLDPCACPPEDSKKNHPATTGRNIKSQKRIKTCINASSYPVKAFTQTYKYKKSHAVKMCRKHADIHALEVNVWIRVCMQTHKVACSQSLHKDLYTRTQIRGCMGWC